MPTTGNTGGYWLRGEAVDSKFQQRCHARVHTVSYTGESKPGFYLSGGACGTDAPLFYQDHKPLPYPVPLCPRSVARLRDTGHMDDGGMVVALNDICFGDPGKSPVVTSTAQSPPSPGNRKK